MSAGSISNIHTIAFEVVPPHDFTKARKEFKELLIKREELEKQQIAKEEEWQEISFKQGRDGVGAVSIVQEYLNALHTYLFLLRENIDVTARQRQPNDLLKYSFISIVADLCGVTP